jgi:two-component system response regulator
VALLSPILLIEENDSDARTLQERLIGQGLVTHIQRLTCPSEAKTHLHAVTPSGGAANPMPSAVILGLGMEARVGFDLVRWIRRHPDLHKVVVIALGELGQLREVQEAYASGANAYFVKGPDCAALIRTLQSAFRSELQPIPERPDTHPAFRNSTDLYPTARNADSGAMANPAPLLLVDDDDAHTRHFTQSLEGLRVRNPLRRVSGAEEAIVYLAGSGIYADRAANPFPIVVFLDIRLADSHKLLAWIEGHPSTRPAGIVALTSSHDMRPVIQAYHLGVHSFLKEPAKLEELRNALSAVPGTELVPDEGGYAVRFTEKR